jgi:hypothetical protein
MSKVEFVKSEDLETLAKEIIEKENINISGAKIDFLFAVPYISKKIGGKLVKTNDILEHYSGVNFIMQISESLFDVLNDEGRYNLVLYNLCKVGFSTNEKTNQTRYSIASPDVVTFNKINKKNSGHDWFYAMREINSSLFDLEPNEAEGFQI